MAEQQQRRKHCRWRPSSPLSLLPSHHRRAAAALHLHSRQRCCCAALERTLRCCSREARPSCKTEKERKRASSFLSFFCFFNAFRRRQICSSAFTFFLVPSLSLPQKKKHDPFALRLPSPLGGPSAMARGLRGPSSDGIKHPCLSARSGDSSASASASASAPVFEKGPPARLRLAALLAASPYRRLLQGLPVPYPAFSLAGAAEERLGMAILVASR